MKANQRIMVVIIIAAALLYFSFQNVQVAPEEGTPRAAIVEKKASSFDCNACDNDAKSKITIGNEDITKTYYVWLNSVFQGEYRESHSFSETCSSQVIACYSDTAKSDWSCNIDNRIKGDFACTDQILKLN